MNKSALLALPLMLACAGAAEATPILGTSGFGAPVVPGTNTVISFNDQVDGSFGSMSLGGFTFSGIGGVLRFSNQFPDQFNGRGARYLDNNAGQTAGLRIDFNGILDAFAFNWGASDVPWTLTAFDAFGNILESMTTPVTHASNAGDYIGFAHAGMAYITLTASSAGDWIFLDNFTFATQQVPEPGSLAVLGLGLAGLAGLRRRKSA